MFSTFDDDDALLTTSVLIWSLYSFIECVCSNSVFFLLYLFASCAMLPHQCRWDSRIARAFVWAARWKRGEEITYTRTFNHTSIGVDEEICEWWWLLEFVFVIIYSVDAWIFNSFQTRRRSWFWNRMLFYLLWKCQCEHAVQHDASFYDVRSFFSKWRKKTVFCINKNSNLLRSKYHLGHWRSET